jgi:pectinesterase
LLALLPLLSFWIIRKETIKVYLIGDSTMADKEEKAYPETGWGMPFAHYFNETVVVDNRAKNGRSTKSFIAEKRWQDVESALKEGDWVLIQFGHNDEVPSKATYTPEADFKANLVRFVTESKNKKAIPVLITPVARRKFDTAGKIQETHEVYAGIVRKVAAEQHVSLIDLDKESQELLQRSGPETSKLLFNYLEPGQNPHYPEGRQDDTHFSELGARRMAELVLHDIKEQHLELADYIGKGIAGDAAQIDPRPFADNAGHWYGIFDKKNIINPLPGRPKYKPTELTNIGDNILLFQKNNGGWPKNYDIFAILTDAQKDSVAAAKDATNTTYDNGSTYNQIAALATIYSVTKTDKYRIAAEKGLDFILRSQYDNGGWPQYYPLEEGYSRHITFNDGVFEGIMRLLKDIRDRAPQYSFVREDKRKALATAFDKGITCIIKSQINDAGQPTAWCQQHDEVSLQPAWARKFEPPSICNGESAGLVTFLMSIDHPDKEIITAVQNAVTWFRDSRIYHIRVQRVPAPRLVTPFRVSVTDMVVVSDSTAPPIWTRYYELGTHRPMFCNRDSKVVYSLAEVERERRDGYGWYTYGPQKVLDQYPEWERKWADKSRAGQAPVYKYKFTVAKDGSGDYRYIQDAIDAMRVFPLARITLYIKNGVYNEKIELPATNTDVSFIGESVDSTIIVFNDYSGRGRLTTFTSWTAKISGNRFMAENITFSNSAGPVGQAVALHVDADSAVFRNCRFLGNQDTIYAGGETSRQYFENCYIEGTTDFIFGPAAVFFRRCTIRCKANSFVTAASTRKDRAYGFVFLDCVIKADSSVSKLYLGRLWRAHARTVFLRCELPAVIAPEGWNNWSNKDNERTAFYAEYGNYGPGADLSHRAGWSHRLTEGEAAGYIHETEKWSAGARAGGAGTGTVPGLP